jgi:hypothetical protein
MIKQKIYASIIEKIFLAKFKPGLREVDFEREDIVKFGGKLKISLPKNLGDLVYSFRYRAALPPAIQSKAGPGKVWIIRPTGMAKYRFVLVPDNPLVPNVNMTVTKVPDCTPGMVAKYAFNDEQALLAKIRYNRLIDVFFGCRLLFTAKPFAICCARDGAGRNGRTLCRRGQERRSLRIPRSSKRRQR